LDRIYKLNKQQNNFLLSVTHEFKTPIAAIRLMLETSKHPKIEITKQSELVDRSIQSTYRLEELAENMLTAMQIESNAYSYNLETVNWSELIRNCIQNQSINGEIRAEIANHISVQGDDFILRMVINNLIENAFKYSGNNPIEVSLKQEGKWKVLSIKDQGIGIRKKDLKNIFKKFYRVQDEETRIAKGTGLGLFIVKQAIEKHQGRVEVVSEINKGTEFKIILP
jgi:signal transduction histidine kinase